MKSAYLAQGLNLLVSILMVPIMLRYLGVHDYVLWAIVTTFGGITQQFEGSLQIVSVREIARAERGGPGLLRQSIRKARLYYSYLSGFSLFSFLAIGLLYINYVVDLDVGRNVEWIIVGVAYSLNYYFAANNSVILGLGHIVKFNAILSVTRLVYFIGAVALFMAGLSIMALCISFSVSVVLSSALNTLAARKAEAPHQSPLRAPAGVTLHGGAVAIASNTAYTLAAFLLLRGSILVAAGIFPNEIVANYTLTIQICAMLIAVATVPTQVWVYGLVNALALGDRERLIYEISRTAVVSNAIFIGGVGFLFFFGNLLLSLIGSSVLISSGLDYFIICGAFFIELNIFLLINILVTKGIYSFAKPYVLIAAVSVLVASTTAWMSGFMVAALVSIPLVVQSCITLPLIFRRVRAEVDITLLDLVRGMWSWVQNPWPRRSIS